METIEERYSLCEHCLNDKTRYCHDFCTLYQKYVGATEQKKIEDEENGKALLYAVNKTTERTKKEMIEKACEFFEQYLVEIGYPDDWCRDSKVQSSGEQRFRKAMEE